MVKDALRFNKVDKDDVEMLVKAYERVLSESGIQIWIKDKDIRYIYANDMMKIADGIGNVDVVGKKDEELYDKYRYTMFTSLDKEVIKSKDTVASTYILPSGSFEEVTKIPICNDDEEVIAVLGYAKDVTAERLLAEHTRRTSEAELKFRKIFDSVPIGLAIFEYRRGTPVLMNSQCENIIKMSREKLKQFSWQNCIADPAVRQEINDKIEEIAAGNIESFEAEGEVIRGDGKSARIKLVLSDFSVGDSTKKSFLCAIWDVTNERIMTEKLEKISSTDGLTGLHSRSWFIRFLEDPNAKPEYPFTVLLGDINGLKICNDAFGHFEGDKLIRAGAAAFTKAADRNPKSYAVRLGGDEFLAILYGVGEDELEQLESDVKKWVSEKSPDHMEYSISLGSTFVKEGAFPDLESAIMSAESKMYAKKLHESWDLGDKLVEKATKLLKADPLENSHMQNVSYYTKLLCEKLNMVPEAQAAVADAARLHDIGISLSNGLREFPGAPIHMDTPVGNNIIRKHSEIGYRLLKFSKTYSYMADFVLCHHERVDGGGFPAGLRDRDIPLESRIIAVADAYDVMTNPRFEFRYSEEKAIEALREKEGHRLDKELTEIFINQVLKEGKMPQEESSE